MVTGKVLWRGVGRVAGGMIMAATILPLFRSNRWWVRAFDFPRLQVGAAALAGAICGARQFRELKRKDQVFVAGLGAAALAQAIQILPYTPFYRREVISAGPREADDVRILTANVLQHNRNSTPLRRFIREREPDIILLTETDSWWEEQMCCLEPNYPYTVRQPMPNTYGMILYSKLELIVPRVRFLVKDSIPSILTRLRLRNETEILFYGVHPEPPGSEKPNGEIRGSGPRDVELVLVARELESVQQPVIVAGDFNDVAWSHTTRLFKRISCLLDPRVGRGMFNTFHADHRMLRYPLDHLFHSDDFALVSFERGPHIGSDHFPILATLRMSRIAPAVQEQKEADHSDRAEAKEILETGPEG